VAFFLLFKHSSAGVLIGHRSLTPPGTHRREPSSFARGGPLPAAAAATAVSTLSPRPPPPRPAPIASLFPPATSSLFPSSRLFAQIQNVFAVDFASRRFARRQRLSVRSGSLRWSGRRCSALLGLSGGCVGLVGCAGAVDLLVRGFSLEEAWFLGFRTSLWSGHARDPVLRTIAARNFVDLVGSGTTKPPITCHHLLRAGCNPAPFQVLSKGRNSFQLLVENSRVVSCCWNFEMTSRKDKLWKLVTTGSKFQDGLGAKMVVHCR
jgi:hypothetical protein